MDALNPEQTCIDSSYNPVNTPNDSSKNEQRPKVSTDDKDDGCAIEFEADEDFYEIQTIENGSFELQVHVPQKFHSHIVGAEGCTKKRIEEETSTEIIVPEVDSEGTSIVIKGISKENIISAKNRLDRIVISYRTKLRFNHFLSIPFASDEIKTSFSLFKEQILNDTEIFGITENMFQNPLKLHLTIAILILMDKEDRAIAACYLQNCRETIVDTILHGAPLNVTLKGVGIMNNNPLATNVLYAKVESEELQQICNGIAGYYVKRGFIRKSHANVKLHVTLINNSFRARKAASGKRTKFIKFDASKILNDFKEFCFGTITIQEIHLSQCFLKSSNGYYHSAEILKMP